MKRLISLVAMAVFVVPVASAQFTITTLFAGGNGGATTGAVYFDIVVGANEVTITGMDWHMDGAAGVTFGISVWQIPGTAEGFEDDESQPWTFSTGGGGVTAGDGNPTPITMDNDIVLAANTTTGFMHHVSTVALNYTNGDGTSYGTGTNQTYSDANLTLLLGSATNTPFNRGGGDIFSPRVANLNIHYDAIPEPASMLVLGIGAAALLARRRRKMI